MSTVDEPFRFCGLRKSAHLFRMRVRGLGAFSRGCNLAVLLKKMVKNCYWKISHSPPNGCVLASQLLLTLLLTIRLRRYRLKLEGSIVHLKVPSTDGVGHEEEAWIPSLII